MMKASKKNDLEVYDLIEAMKLQKEGWTIGDLAEKHNMSIAEMERQLGVVHTREGTRYTDVWQASYPRSQGR